MLNKVILMGRITKDLELRQTQSGKSLLKFTVAVDRGSGDNKQTDFISCVAWEKRAEFINSYFGKGRMIAVVGNIKTGSYDDRDGRKVYTTDVWVDEASFTGEKKADDRPRSGEPPVSSSMPDYEDLTDFNDDGVPF